MTSPARMVAFHSPISEARIQITSEDPRDLFPDDYYIQVVSLAPGDVVPFSLFTGTTNALLDEWSDDYSSIRIGTSLVAPAVPGDADPGNNSKEINWRGPLAPDCGTPVRFADKVFVPWTPATQPSGVVLKELLLRRLKNGVTEKSFVLPASQTSYLDSGLDLSSVYTYSVTARAMNGRTASCTTGEVQPGRRPRNPARS